MAFRDKNTDGKTDWRDDVYDDIDDDLSGNNGSSGGHPDFFGCLVDGFVFLFIFVVGFWVNDILLCAITPWEIDSESNAKTFIIILMMLAESILLCLLIDRSGGKKHK